MPQVAIPALIAAGTSALAGASISAIALSAATTFLTAGASMLFARKPKRPGPSSSIRQATPIFLPEVYGDCRVGGVAALYHGGDEDGGEYDKDDLVTAWVLAGHQVEAIDEIWDGDRRLWTATGGIEDDFENDLVVDVRLGTAGQTTPPDLLSALGSKVDANFRLSGKAWAYIRYRRIDKRWRDGLPQNLWFRVRGKRVFDPRSGQTAYSANWALCFRDFLISRGGLAAENFDDAQISAAANLCDELVGGRARYEMNGSVAVTPSSPARDHVADWLKQGGNLRGLVNVGDQLRLLPGAYVAPANSYGPDDFVSPLMIGGATVVEERWEGVQVTFSKTSNRFRATDAKTHYLSTYAGEPKDARVNRLELPYETRWNRAQRLGLLALRQSQRFRSIEVGLPVRSDTVRLLPGDRVTIQNPTLGIDGVFEITSRAVSLQPSNPVVTINAIEDDPSFWDWVEADATEPPDSLSSTITSARRIAPPSNVSATANRRVEEDGSVTRWVDVDWEGSAGPYVSHYEVAWTQGGDRRSARTGQTDYRINNLGRNAAVSVEVAAINTLGVVSDFVGVGSVVTPTGDTTPPGPPTNATIRTFPDGFAFLVGNPDDEDLAGMRLYEGDAGVSFAATFPILDVAATRSGADTHIRVDDVPPETTRRYYITAFDRSGNESAPFGPLQAQTRAAVDAQAIDDAIAAVDAELNNAVTQLASGIDQAEATTAILRGDHESLAGVFSSSIILRAVNGREEARIGVTASSEGSRIFADARDFIASGTISAPLIQAGAITAEKADFESLSAINLTVDTLDVEEQAITRTEQLASSESVPGTGLQRLYIRDTISVTTASWLFAVGSLQLDGVSPYFNARFRNDGQTLPGSLGESTNTDYIVITGQKRIGAGNHIVRFEFQAPSGFFAVRGNMSLQAVQR